MLGMNTKTIKEITGHKKDSVFNKYIKISEDFKKLEMERTWDSIPTEVKKSGKSQKKKRRNEFVKLLKNSCLLMFDVKIFIKFVSAKRITL